MSSDQPEQPVVIDYRHAYTMMKLQEQLHSQDGMRSAGKIQWKAAVRHRYTPRRNRLSLAVTLACAALVMAR